MLSIFFHSYQDFSFFYLDYHQKLDNFRTLFDYFKKLGEENKGLPLLCQPTLRPKDSVC